MNDLTQRLHGYRFSIRSKLAFISIISLLPSLFIVWVSAFNLRRASERTWHSEMARTCDAVAGQMGLIIRGTEQVLETIAASNAVSNMDLAAMQNYMNTLVSRKSEYATILMVNTEKSVIAAGIPVSTYSLADREYLRESLEKNRFVVGSYTISRSTGLPIIPMALPVQDQSGIIRGVLIASLRIDSLAASLPAPALGREAVIEIVDPNGIRVWRTPVSATDPVGQYVNPAFYRYSQNPLSRQFEAHSWQNREYRFVASPVALRGPGKSGYTVIMGDRTPGFFDASGMNSRLGQLGGRVNPLALYVGLGTIAISISFLLSSLMYRRYVGLRLARLTKEAARLGMQGRIPLRNRQNGEDEIDLIARTLRESGIAIRMRNRENEAASARIADSLKEKETLLKEIHHRVKNNFQVISSLLSLQAMSTEDAEVLRLFDESRNRIQSMALIHEQLYRSDNYAWIDFAEYARSLAHQISLAWYDRTEQISLQVQGESCPLPLDNAVPLGLALNELISNGFKHAFGPTEGGRIVVSLEGSEEGWAHLRVQDNGRGLPSCFSVAEHANLGLELINTLCSQLKGTLDIASPVAGMTRGCGFTIRFPLPEGFSWSRPQEERC